MKNYLKFPLPTGKEWFRLPERVKELEEASPSSVATSGSSLYSTSPAAGPIFSTDSGIFLGKSAGKNATNANYSNFLGHFAGYGAIDANYSNFFGAGAGYGATGALNSVFIGENAGSSAVDSHDSVFIGTSAGINAISTPKSIFIGVSAGANSEGRRVIALGENAANGNTLDSQTVIANTSLPSFANHAAAALALTVVNGASTGSTYLYHNQATNSIGAVRL